MVLHTKRKISRATKYSALTGIVGAVVVWLFSAASVDQTTATIQALRLNGTITGGAIPYSDPVFVNMVADIQSGNYARAAADAVNSKYFPYYLPRRMAKEMMNSSLSESGIPDNDPVVFIVANLLGLAGTQPTIANLWSQNATYCLSTTAPGVTATNNTATNYGSCGTNELHAFYNSDSLAFDWTTAIVKKDGQMISAADQGGFATTPIAVAAKDVGGYMTLSGRNDDQTLEKNFSFFAYSGGTNLRAIEYLYEISLGVTLASMQNTAGVTADMTPKFIPSNNPNFLVGNNQAACISCHGGGASSRLHGYATFADLFDMDMNGARLIYIPKPNYPESSNGKPGKSFGSNGDLTARLAVYKCNQAADPTLACNPASPGVSETQAWDLTYWQSVGLLAKWGWNGPITGSGLNSLGVAVGKSTLVYQNMVTRVVNEICPLGTISPAQINNIAAGAMAQEAMAQASTNQVSTDQGPFGYIVVHVASDPSCI